MFSLQRIFEAIAEPGIIGPHGDSEADLLLAGVKPIGLMACVDKPQGKGIPVQKKCHEDIEKLDQAVSNKKLIKKVIRQDNFYGNGNGFTGHFYAQPDMKEVFNQFIRFHEKMWLEDVIEPMPDDTGKYYGYTDKDIELWQKGGYGSLPPIERYFMYYTNGIRRYCRIKSILNNDQKNNI